MPPTPSHTATIRKWFGLAEPTPPHVLPHDLELPGVAAGEVMLITGPSGAGKTTLLRRLLACDARAVIVPDSICLPNRALVDCFGLLPLHETLTLLARCGLAEAWTYLRTPAALSQGEHWRLRLAMALARAQHIRQPALLALDEFAAVLDRVTAAVVARALCKIIRASPQLSAICATSHEDLAPALAPNVHVQCDFGDVRIVRRDVDPHTLPNTPQRHHV